MAGAWVEVKGKERLKAKLTRLATGVASDVEEVAVMGAIPVMEAAKRFAPKRDRTLEKSIHIGGHEERASDYDGNYERGQNSVPEPIVTTTTAAVFVGTDIVYGAQREYGGTISAKNAPRLVWQDYDGNWHSAVSVYQNPTPYLRPAADEVAGQRSWLSAMAKGWADKIRSFVR